MDVNGKIPRDAEVVVYLGTHKISAFVGRITEKDCQILGYRQDFKADGFKNGLVVNLEAAATTLENLLDALLPGRGLRDLEVSVVLANSKLKVYPFSSSQYYENQRAVSTHDICAVIEQTRSVATLPLTQHVLQVVPESFLVNDIGGIRDPLGLEANRLGVNLQIFTMDYQDYKNIGKVFEAADFTVKGFWPRMLTVSEGVLFDQEKEEGVILIDVADRMTKLVAWKDNRLTATRILETAGYDISRNIMNRWQIDFRDAERVKEQFGTLEINNAFGDELIPLVSRNGKDQHQIRREEFHYLFLDMMQEWLDKILTEADRLAQDEKMAYPHFVFTGGGIAFDGFLEFLTQRFRKEGRVGLCRKMDAPQEILVDSSLTPALGMYHWLAQNQKEYESLIAPQGFLAKKLTHAKEWFYSYF